MKKFHYLMLGLFVALAITCTAFVSIPELTVLGDMVGITVAVAGFGVADRTIYTFEPGQLGRIARDGDYRERNGLVAFGKIPFGFGVQLVEKGEGVAVVGADSVVDSLAVGAGNAGLILTTLAKATWVRFFILNPGTNNASLEVAMTGAGTQADPYVIGVSTATDGSATITSTASQVKTALEADEDIAAVISVALAGTGASAVVAFSEAPLVKNVADLRFDGVAGFVSSASDIENEAYLDSDLCKIWKTGNVWVPCLEAIHPGDDVRVRLVTDGANLAGMFCKTAVPNQTAKVSGCRFYANQPAGNVELELFGGDYQLTLDT